MGWGSNRFEPGIREQKRVGRSFAGTVRPVGIWQSSVLPAVFEGLGGTLHAVDTLTGLPMAWRVRKRASNELKVDGVVPFAVEVVAVQVDRGELRVGDGDALGVVAFVELGVVRCRCSSRRSS